MCLCTGVTYIMGTKCPTSIVIPVNLTKVPMMKQAYKSYRMIENVKMQNVSSDA